MNIDIQYTPSDFWKITTPDGCGVVSITIKDFPVTAIAGLRNLPEMIAEQIKQSLKMTWNLTEDIEQDLHLILDRNQK